MEIEDSVKNDFLIFFSFEFIKDFFLAENISSTCLEQAKHLDIEAMSKEWPKIAGYLKQHCNFYDHLSEIVLGDLIKSNETKKEFSGKMGPWKQEEQLIPNEQQPDPLTNQFNQFLKLG